MDKAELIGLLYAQRLPAEIIHAFENIKREDYVQENFRSYAYENYPLTIGHEQTISQPTTIAFMLDQLELLDDQNILEIGSGSGYVLALINNISKNSRITGIERIKELADASRKHFLNNKNIERINTNGFHGYKKNAPYDRILMSAAAESINQNIINQLSDKGIAVLPVKNSIYKIVRNGNDFYQTEYQGFMFVPLIE